MLVDAPVANIAGELRALRGEQEARSQRNMQGAQDLLRGNALSNIMAQYDAAMASAQGQDEKDAVFSEYYRRVSAIDRSAAESMREQYQTQKSESESRAQAAGISQAYKSGGTEGAIGALMGVDPEKAISLAMRGGGAGLDESDRIAVERRSLQALVTSERFSRLSADEQKPYMDRLAALDASLSGTKYAPEISVSKNAQQTQKPTPSVDKFGLAKSEAEAIISEAKDADRDGYIDGSAAIRDRIELIIRNSGLSKNDADFLRGMLANKEREISQAVEGSRGKAEAAAKSRQARQADYENWLKNTLPKIDATYSALVEMRNGFESAKSQGARSPIGGAYIAMKKTLGDALSGSDFSGIAGFGVGQGIISKLKASVGASAMTEAQAKEVLDSSVNGFNEIVRQYNAMLDQKTRGANQDFSRTAKTAYGVSSIAPLRAPTGKQGSILREKKVRKVVSEEEFFGGK